MLETKEHPGCMVSGYVLVNRVPGNFHIEARSLHHNLNAAMTNLSHVVNHLSFGTPLASSTERKLSKYAQFQSNYPLDGGRFISPDFQVGGLMSKMRDVIRYQTLVQSQVMHYSEMDVPEAKFAYDLSPMAVVVSSKGRRWYDFVTSVCAIV